MKELFTAILHLKDEKECKQFMRDLCTLAELKAMSERWQVAKLVYEKIPYRKIAEITGSSTATITRVARWLKNGKGGYKSVLDRLMG